MQAGPDELSDRPDERAEQVEEITARPLDEPARRRRRGDGSPRRA